MRRPLPILLFLLAVACGGPPSGADTPVTFAVSSVAVEGLAPSSEFAPSLDGPLRPIAVSPSGPAVSNRPIHTVSVTFSRPVAPIGGGVPPAGALILDPPVDGALTWNGSRSLVFSADVPLPPATRFTALVSGITALDGTALESEVRWDFETLRPRVLETAPSPGDEYWPPDLPLRIRFDQSVSSSDASAFIRLTSEGGGRVPATITTDGDSSLVVTPNSPLRPNARYALEIRAGFRARVGDLGTTGDLFGFRTLGPLRLVQIEQSRAWWDDTSGPYRPDRGVLLTFSTPVFKDSLLSALTITPDVDWMEDALEPGLSPSTTHSLPGPWASSTRYELTISNLTDSFGQTLESANRAFQTGVLPPSFTMPSGVMYLEAGRMAGLPVRTTGVSSVQAAMVPLQPDDLFTVLRAYDQHHGYGALPEGAPEPQAAEPDETLRFEVQPGERLATEIPLDGQGSNVVAFRVEVPDLREYEGSRQFLGVAVTTRLAITAKFSPHESLATVTLVDDASPVAGADIEVRDAEGAVQWTGTTEEDGTASFPGWVTLGIEPPSEWDRPVLHVVARLGDDWTFVSSPFQDGIEPYRFDVPYRWYPDPNPTAGSVFSDRGLYRAADTVHLKGVVRSRTSGDWSPITDSLRIFVISPRDETILDQTVHPSRLGTFDLSWLTPNDATQGTYRVRLAYADDPEAATREPWQEGDITSSSFRIDAFRTATFNVEAASIASSYVAGDIFEGWIAGRYLFGADMQRAPVRATLTRTNGSFRPPGLASFDFGSYWDYGEYVYDTLIETDTLLAADGTLRRRATLPAHGGGQPTQLNWEGSVQSPDGQEQSGRSRLIIHPAEFYLGVQTSSAFLDLSREDQMHADVVAVTPSGTAFGPTNVTVELIRREWHSVREIGWDGRARWRSETVDVVVASEAVAVESGRAARVRFHLPAPGSYIVRALGLDTRGNSVRTESPIWASGRGYVSWQRSDDDLLRLVADRDEYQPGQTARILIPSPFEEATALVTIERDGVMRHEVRTLSGSAPQIDIPVLEDYLPNVFVGVVLLSGRTSEPAAGGDVGAPAFRAGYAHLPVSAAGRRLAVEMTASADTLRPGAEITVDFRLRDASGRGVAGEIAFSAADAGVVDLIRYRLPNPFDAFYGTRPLDVTTAETRAHLVRQRSFGQKEEDMGGGGGDAEFLLRKDFRAQAHWAPSIQADAQGRAQITFRLPESLTTYRLMAAAVGEGNRFGRGDHNVVTTQPLVLQPAVPRFARVGDSVEAGVLVTNRTRQPAQAQISVSGSFEYTGPVSQSIDLAAGETRRVGFPAMLASAGPARAVFDATMGVERDAFEITLPVLENLTPVTSALFASTDGNVTERLVAPAGFVQGRGELEVTAASTALVGLDGAVEYLFEYPYGCLEQRTARVRPLVLAGDLLDTFQLEALGGERDEVIGEWLRDLDTFWTGTGFSLWPGGSYDHPFVTAMVLATLVEAQEAGYDIPTARIEAVARVVERSVRNASDRPFYLPAPAWQDSRAFMLLALSKAGRYLETEVADLADAYLTDSRASIDGMAHLVQVLAEHGRLPQRRVALLDAVRRHVRLEADGAYAQAPEAAEYAWIFASDTRASAGALSALAAAGENRDIAEQLVRGLMRQRPTGHWSTTQDNAAVIDGLVAYRHAFESSSPDFEAVVDLAGTEILRHAFRQPSLQTASALVAGDALPQEATLDLTARGTGRMYYSVRLESLLSSPPQPASNGLRISRTIQRLDRSASPVGGPLRSGGSDLQFATGDLLLVTVRLESPTDRNYIVVDDPLPAGLEPVNTDFATTRGDLGQMTGSDQWWGSFNHTELRDDRVLLFADYLRAGEHTYRYVARAGTPGDYYWPGIGAEAMYRPSVNARGVVGRATVVIDE